MRRLKLGLEVTLRSDLIMAGDAECYTCIVPDAHIPNGLSCDRPKLIAGPLVSGLGLCRTASHYGPGPLLLGGDAPEMHREQGHDVRPVTRGGE